MRIKTENKYICISHEKTPRAQRVMGLREKRVFLSAREATRYTINRYWICEYIVFDVPEDDWKLIWMEIKTKIKNRNPQNVRQHTHDPRRGRRGGEVRLNIIFDVATKCEWCWMDGAHLWDEIWVDRRTCGLWIGWCVNLHKQTFQQDGCGCIMKIDIYFDMCMGCVDVMLFIDICDSIWRHLISKIIDFPLKFGKICQQWQLTFGSWYYQHSALFYTFTCMRASKC